MKSDVEASDRAASHRPLVVDLDGTLIRSDLLIESAFIYLGQSLLNFINVLTTVFRGKAALKDEIAQNTEIDVAHLPYDEEVLSLIRAQREAGRPVFLATASNERYARAVVGHLQLFDGWFASSQSENLTSEAKARRLVAEFGVRGFDYVGNDRADLAVWSAASRPFAVGASRSVKSNLQKINPDTVFLSRTTNTPVSWINLLRIHQWAKNALIFVPLITSRHFDLASLAQALAAVVAFSLVASGMYILNDLIDLEADRRHPTKKARSLAAGSVSIVAAVCTIPILLATGLGIALAINTALAGVLIVYLLLTTAYTLFLKRKMLVDVITLALLYTIRVVAGAVAISVPLSEWLLAFSLFIFTALALIKRYIELATRIDRSMSDPVNRNYRKSDLDIVAALAAGAAFNAVTIFILYISSEPIRSMYRRPEALWLICPILMFWLARALMIAHRRLMHDDPIVFALRDRISYVALALIGLIILGASY